MKLFENNLELKSNILAILLALIALIMIMSIGYWIGQDSVSCREQTEHIILEGNSFKGVSSIAYPKYQTYGVFTKYTNRVEETDSTPNITASGQKVRDGIVANNCHEIGTFIEVGGETYEVLDRMNSRYGCEYYDLFTFDLDEALEFGRQEKKVIVY